MTKVAFISLGCVKNLVDTEVMLNNLYEAGFEITFDVEEAEIVVVNTCGFIESAKQESIDNILDVAELKEYGKCKHIIATGCLAERYREEVMRELPEVEALVGVGSLHKIVEACTAVMEGKAYTSFEDKNKSPLGGGRVLTTMPHTAYLKIAEGCDNLCTYCAIPLIRGKLRSRKIEDIVEEARQLELEGVKELNLIAQDTTRYGLDLYGEYKLCELVQEICKATNIPWIRLLYCYPDKITDELIDEMRNNPRLVSYMDIPIQHISDKILKAMNRHGDGALIRATVNKLRARVPDIVLRTTAMVGFPGEDDGDFEELCEFVKEAKFERFGAFTYSPEEDTVAATLPCQIDPQLKQDRYDVLMQTQLLVTEEKMQALIGRVRTVLIDGYDPAAEVYFGRSYADAPDVDGKIFVRARRGALEVGEFCEVRIVEALDYDLVADPV